MNSLPGKQEEMSGQEIGQGIAHVLRYMENKQYNSSLSHTSERLENL